MRLTRVTELKQCFLKVVNLCKESSKKYPVNFWNWSVNWDLPINPGKCNKSAIRRDPPFQLYLATGSPGNSIKATNV